MKIVRSTLRNDVCNRPATAAIFGTVGVCQNRHFAVGGAVVWLKGLPCNRIIVVILTIDQEVVRAWTRSIYDELRSICPQPEIAIVSVSARDRCGTSNTSLRQYQRNRVQIRVWEIVDFRFAKCFAQVTRLSLQFLADRCFDEYTGAERSDFQHPANSGRNRTTHIHVRYSKLREPGGFHAYGVATGQQRIDPVAARGV